MLGLRPFLVTEETKAMVLDNITHLLNNFLACSSFEHVIFSWVLHREEILHQLLESLELEGVLVKEFTLVARSRVLQSRLERDMEAGLREPGVLERSLSYLALNERADELIDTSDLELEEITQKIIGEL